ncbi:hypothetical protein J8I87_11025 [Paraburkholderia sp. LEh10]|uniref:hypothetical protein n=1 Tax=Paraburkholderia sp. LEh10 TaxID=2821353 RepID=UPI001AE174D3|nr:hypothetical protein [Paraburkholderia sp. LEh10]MBP0590235.1 hypothetical protein [Paraburkholderia sp. LEh10]
MRYRTLTQTPEAVLDGVNSSGIAAVIYRNVCDAYDNTPDFEAGVDHFIFRRREE